MIRFILIFPIFVISIIVKAQQLTGLYTNKELEKQSEVILNLHPDSSFIYFFLNAGSYGVKMIDRSGKFIAKNNELILLSIITKDTTKFNDSIKVISNNVFDYADYFELQSGTYSSKPEICIQFDDSIKKLFPELRVFLDYDFKNEIVLNQYNNAVFEYPKNTVLRYINLRCSYFSIDIDFDNYYRTVENNDWRVSKNLLTIKMRDKLLEFKKLKFKTFAKYFIIKNKFELKYAIEPDYCIMLENPITLILSK
jgi:hypothetical protein